MKTKILIIDNEQDLVDSIVEFLSIQGFEAIPCYSGEKAIESLLLEKPELIICDLNMSGINGYDVLEAVRGIKKYENIPFLFLTGMADESSRRKGMIKGADDFIVKPFKYQNLIASVNTALEKSRKRKEKIDTLTHELSGKFASLNEVNFLNNHEVRSNLAKIIQTLDLMAANAIEFDKGMPIVTQSALVIDEVTSHINEILSDKKFQLEGLAKKEELKFDKILLLDDDTTQIMLNTLVVKKWLKPSQVVSFSKGTEAISYLKENKVDVIFLDFNMPEMSGLEVLYEMNLLELKIPVVMLSSTLDPDQINNCYEFTNVCNYIVKPLNPASLKKLQVA